jgi:hypothetical protein
MGTGEKNKGGRKPGVPFADETPRARSHKPQGGRRSADVLEFRVRRPMSNVLIHKASELKPATRAALEVELGRLLGDDEDVSIMAFPAHDPPADEARIEAGRKLNAYFARIDGRRANAPDEEGDAALDEALKRARPGYHERK